MEHTYKPLFMAIKQEDYWIKIADEFYTHTNFPNIIGAINGKHIRMIQPEHSGTSYFNYKKFFSCVLMAWTDADYKFVYIDVGSYGTASDSEIFKTSDMGKRLSENQLNIPSGKHLQMMMTEMSFHSLSLVMKRLDLEITF